MQKIGRVKDSSGVLEFENIQVAAVADGHGGADYFRSEFGSKLAIDVLFEQVKIFCKDLKPFERISDTGIKNFKFDLVKQWRNAVKKDWQERLNGGTLGEGEIRYKSVSKKYKARYTSENPKIVENYLYTAYGTTLICAISIGAQIKVVQIGDGSCVVLQKNGEFISPVPTDNENFLNVTTSLCDEKSELKIRHAVLNCEKNSQNSPVAIFLSTDGLDDCFPYYKNSEHLYKFYAGVIIENMLEFGYGSTEDEIKAELLGGLSQKVSHDDISLAYFVPENLALLRETYSKIDAVYKSEEKKVEEIKAVEEIKPVEVIPAVKETKNFQPLPKKILKANEISISATPVVIPAGKTSAEGKAIL